MFKKEDIIKLDCRTSVLKFLKKQLDSITIADFYSVEEYDLIRKEYTEIAEMVRDKDKLMELRDKHKQGKNNNIRKYFNFDR